MKKSTIKRRIVPGRSVDLLWFSEVPLDHLWFHVITVIDSYINIIQNVNVMVGKSEKIQAADQQQLNFLCSDTDCSGCLLMRLKALM